MMDTTDSDQTGPNGGDANHAPVGNGRVLN
jgi:hypothetical protein